MITKMTGILTRVLDDECRVQIGPFEYQVMIPEYLRRNIQTKTDEEITLHISEYLEGSQMSNRLIPRRIGFLSELELEFFDLFCTVDKIGARKALKALGRPIREIAEAIQRSDAKWLTTLAGIGKTSAEQIIATLKSKVTKFTLFSEGTFGSAPEPLGAGIDPQVVDDSYAALTNLGMNPSEARDRIDQVLKSGQKPATVQEFISLAFAVGKKG
ncbi:ATP-dependent DNA helicase RuvA [Telmatocola sphagniphila]|uniref:Holliday junction branch migration complex subunit RuvA n=1 Tax=Telmatocola sphagniphila TaxID=1123043 RepID=A0A8E6B4Y8_9BACT|nr:Holliday junction branch migration protein RuvA [Telmatocola sphagniphila]QVL31442.1 ATP-dependent DNA helicase RuvA [Telmatocola sphagniphila]